jgi:hypothetical protein
MLLKNTLGSLALATALASLGSGCVIRAHGRIAAPVAYVEVEEEPPPPRVVVMDSRPGFIWVEGRWYRQGGQWVWRDGYWERERVGYYWEQGRWERRGRGHVWVEGRWRGGGGSAYNPPPGHVRDHRANPPGPPPHAQGNGPTVRDHRANPPPPPPAPAPTVRDHRSGPPPQAQEDKPKVRDHRQ